MPKIISIIGSGVLGALVALEAQPGQITWRSALLGAIAFLTGIGVPAVHNVTVGTSSASAGVAPPFQDVPPPPAPPPPAQQQVQ